MMKKVHFDFTGKRALVTGAGKGIGRAVAKALIDSGAEVIAVTRTQADLDSLKAEVAAEGKPSNCLVCVAVDVGDAGALRPALEGCGDIDLVVNNAGINVLQTFLETTADAFDLTMSVNLRACLVASQVAAESMIRRGVKGTIVNVSSQASLLALPKHTAYCASKAALDMLTKSAALELGPHGIRCNAVNPTVVMTDLGKAAWAEAKKSAPMLDGIPLERFAGVDEVVQPILFLLSEGASMINGTVLPVDGGFTCAATLRKDAVLAAEKA
ncbi:unnamed protein product [Vitrella brassicaformis CCMP3155]|uniref:Ketoreductase domain-containing protein n=1 Tax=Vitrella brassicaformis (strain CCMP3155) TaxID=1169540 RepID=A0A0G4E8E3_VITBC|nr:unnamed protein product [Vitrella brassicaformis CCMP3155]|mmetsp:Transcript_11339/g.27425  ORF Transcript_11339/g.27425 Transcript_11339/m.27425 type:complete len:270 (-) Transcript_11339:1842-2651(-)|eukprot:CEL91992.1 unnamed protein product [Vitrella brassicaformis CCMP3155]